MGNLSEIIQAVEARLTHHAAQDGRLLSGWKLHFNPEPDVDGARDLPSVRLFLPTHTEGTRPVTIADGKLTVRLYVGTRRSAGTVEHVQGIEKVLDALETPTGAVGGTAAALETALERAIARGLDIKMTDSFLGDISYNAQIEVTLTPRPVARGGRSA